MASWAVRGGKPQTPQKPHYTLIMRLLGPFEEKNITTRRLAAVEEAQESVDSGAIAVIDFYHVGPGFDHSRLEHGAEVRQTGGKKPLVGSELAVGEFEGHIRARLRVVDEFQSLGGGA